MPEVILNFFFGKCKKCHAGKTIAFNWKLGLPSLKQQNQHMLEITLTNEQKVSAELSPVTAKGKSVEVENIQWTVVSGTCTVEVDPNDEKKATILSGDDIGDSEVLVEADADLGEGVETISDMIKVTVAGARAQSLGLTLGVPETK